MEVVRLPAGQSLPGFRQDRRVADSPEVGVLLYRPRPLDLLQFQLEGPIIR